MLANILLSIAKFTYGSKILAIVNDLHLKTVGHRTELLILIELLVELSKILKLLDAQIADTIKLALLGAMGPTLAEKIGRIQNQVESVIPKEDSNADHDGQAVE